jgi:hypothetical protein
MGWFCWGVWVSSCFWVFRVFFFSSLFFPVLVSSLYTSCILSINATTTQDSHSKYESCAAQLYPKLVDKKPISSGLIQTPGSKLES